MNRREFLSLTGSAFLAYSIGGLRPVFSQDVAPAATGVAPQVVWVENDEPAKLLAAALKEFGGIKTFVSSGDTVVVKPNIGWDSSPELAGNTNPDLIAEIVKECLNAGAKKVKVFDRTCNNPERCYTSSQIEEKALAAGAEVTHIEDSRFVTKKLTRGEILKEWPIYQDYLEADKVINVPIAKHHRMATITLGLKNLMGVMGGERGEIHNSFTKKIVDIGSEILPTLTIIDAYRILLRNGPRGGDPGDVKLAKTLIMSPCTISADVVALNLMGHTLPEIEYLQEATVRNLQKYDVKNLGLKKIVLNS